MMTSMNATRKGLKVPKAVISSIPVAVMNNIAVRQRAVSPLPHVTMLPNASSVFKSQPNVTILETTPLEIVWATTSPVARDTALSSRLSKLCTAIAAFARALTTRRPLLRSYDSAVLFCVGPPVGSLAFAIRSVPGTHVGGVFGMGLATHASIIAAVTY